VLDNSAQSKLGSWSSRIANLTIEYPAELIEEMTRAGFDGAARRGVETGGVIFGIHQGRSARMAAWRPMPCEHARGNALILSEKDLRSLARLLEDAKTDPELKRLDVLGWFVSRPANGSGLALTADDLQIFNLCFPAPWQFTMALAPAGTEPARAAFFVRDAEGNLCEREPAQDFGFDAPRVAAANGSVIHNGRRPAGNGTVEEATILTRHAPPATQILQRPPSIHPVHAPLGNALARQNTRPMAAPRMMRERKRGHSRRLRWLWAIPAVTIFALTGLLIANRDNTYAPPPTLALRLQEVSGGQLQIEWDKNAPQIQSAHRGVITIYDSGASTFDLGPQRLRAGLLTYTRKTGQVKVNLAVFNENAGGPSAQESAQFVGPPPASVSAPPPPENNASWPTEKSKLEAEIKRLKAELAQESEKRAELQNLVRILEARQGVNPDR
jgi:hypothetical protein